MKKHPFLLLLILFASCTKQLTEITDSVTVAGNAMGWSVFSALDQKVHRTGRFADGLAYAAGAYINTRFYGPVLQIQVSDEKPAGTHNVMLVIIDGVQYRRPLWLKDQNLNFRVEDGLHTLVVCKETDSNEGYVVFNRILCMGLEYPEADPLRAIELYGDSQTSGLSMLSPCTNGFDEADAYNSYGMLTARNLDARVMLTSLAGMNLTGTSWGGPGMGVIFDKLSLTRNILFWDFSRYQPNLVIVCLGQNDGLASSFQAAGLSFLQTLRGKYPWSEILVISSPMQNEGVKQVQKLAWLTNIALLGDQKIDYYQIGSYHGDPGCGWHPTDEQHALIAQELTAYIRPLMGWW